MLGVVCPYGWGESTRLAFLLVEHLNQRLIPCRWLSMQSRERHLHEHWDHRVLPYCQHRFRDWFAPLSQIVWFVNNPLPLKWALRAGKDNLRVVLPASASAGDLRWLSTYDRLLTPGPGCSPIADGQYLRSSAFRWLPPPTDAPRQELFQKDAVRVWWPLRGNLSRSPSCTPLLEVWWALLDRHPHLHLTLNHSRQFCLSALQRVGEMRDRFGPRLAVLRKLPYEAQRQQPANHDVTYWHPSRDSSGIEVAESLALHTPVLSIDTETVRWWVRDGHSGRLLPALRQMRTAGCEAYDYWDCASILAFLDEQLSDPDGLVAMRRLDWAETRMWRRSFESRWDRIGGYVHAG